LKNFLRKVFFDTRNHQIMIAPDFTTCPDCGLTDRGLKQHCPFCGSTRVEKISMIAQYFSRVSSWNKGKLSELSDRVRITSL